MTEAKAADQLDEAAQAPAALPASAEVNRRIPATSVAVMIFILLVAFACTGVTVVTEMVDAKHAQQPIYGKDGRRATDYPTPGRLPDGVAASVNGVEIPESQISNFIAGLRAAQDLESQEAWDEWMIENGQNTETIRNRVILYYVNNEMIDQIAEEMGIHPTAEDYQQTRDEAFATPESTQAIEEALASEGRTLEDYEADIVAATKRRLIGEVGNAGTVDTPEFKEAVLKGIQDRYPEYAEATSLDEVDPQIVEEITAEFKELSDYQTFSSKVDAFVKDHDVLYSKISGTRPYDSNADEYFMKQNFLQMLEQNGILGEGGLFDSLMANAEDADAS